MFVVNDGKSPTEQVAVPITVPAAEWPTYTADGSAQAVEELRQQVQGTAPGGAKQVSP